MPVDEKSFPSNIFIKFPTIKNAITRVSGQSRKERFDGASKLDFLMISNNRKLIENDELSSMKKFKTLGISRE